MNSHRLCTLALSLLPMRKKFYVGVDRYGAIRSSRYKQFTYGRSRFSEPEIVVPEKQAHGTYGALLFDKRWIAKRVQILIRDSHQCAVCKRNQGLQVHHRQYHFIKALNQFKAPWDYENYLLVTLCDRCHSRGHSKFRVPNVYL
jgi:hypothetical protein